MTQNDDTIARQKVDFSAKSNCRSESIVSHWMAIFCRLDNNCATNMNKNKKIARKFRYMSSVLNRLLAFAQQFSADSIEKKMVRCFATLCQLMRYKNTIKRDEMTEEHFRGEKSSIWLFLLVHASTELHRERVRVPRRGVGIYPNYISYYLFLFHLIA